MELQIALIRCGATESAEQGRLGDGAGESLSEQGKMQLAQRVKLGDYPAVSLAYTDQTPCGHETAVAIYPQVPTVIMKGMQAFDYGDFEGGIPAQIAQDKLFQTWTASGQTLECPNGEHAFAFQMRCARGFRSIAQEMSAKGIESVAIIAHQTVISAVMQRYCIPRSACRNWELDWGGAHIMQYNTLQSTASLRDTL